jgi:hypothetical protein
VSPILVRPVREQLEHDRVIRLLQAKNKRKFDVGINPGHERTVPVGAGPAAVYPDLVLSSLERGRRLQAIVEVETGESVNHLEALAQWAPFSKLRAPFHLYVPSTMVDVARRLCEDNQIPVTEMWSYHGIGDDVRFTLVQRTREVPPPARRPSSATPAAPVARKPRSVARPAAVRTGDRPATRPAARPAARTAAARPARAAKTAAKPARKPARAQRRK